jgi:hypothetical protein
MKANDILRASLDTLVQRGVKRDQPDGERSMPRIVRVFEAITGIRLTEREGLLFMVALKLVREARGAPDADDYIDLANYVALTGEAALATGKESLPVDPAVPPQTAHERALQIKGYERHLQQTAERVAERAELHDLLRQRKEQLRDSIAASVAKYHATYRTCAACDGTGNCAIDRSAAYTRCRACGGTGTRNRFNGAAHLRRGEEVIIEACPRHTAEGESPGGGDTPAGPYTLDADGNLSGPAGTHNVAEVPDGVCPVCAGDGFENRKLGTLCRTCTGTGAL